MKTETLLEGLVCLEGIMSSVFDSYTIVDKYFLPLDSSTVPHFGAANIMLSSIYLSDDLLEVASSCYRSVALFSAAGTLFAGFPTASIEIIVRQCVIAPKIFSKTHEFFNPDDHLVNTSSLALDLA